MATSGLTRTISPLHDRGRTMASALGRTVVLDVSLADQWTFWHSVAHRPTENPRRSRRSLHFSVSPALPTALAPLSLASSPT